MKWAYGITTVPSRVDNLLPQTMASLAKAGFDAPVLFIDGACDIGHIEGMGGLVIRHPPAGHLPNWMGALTGLYTNSPDAERYAIFEDDLLACSHLREYLEQCGYPGKGYLNLLTHDCNLRLAGVELGWFASNQKGKGAVGLVFDRATVQQLMRSDCYVTRMTSDNPNARCADGMVIDSLAPLGYREYTHQPSLLQHVGFESTFPLHNFGEVVAFAGENFNPLPILKLGNKLERLMTEQQAITAMVAPGTPRMNAWRRGVIQIHVTRACDLACYGCTQGSNLGGKPVIMTPKQFEIACQSLKGYWGVVGMFGGNPALHPQFEELCEILNDYFPQEQCGIWCNHPRGNGKKMRMVFNPGYSNLNVHLSQEAYDEFKRDWPECHPVGLYDDSLHSPPFVALQDVIKDEAERWKMISDCDINKYWSAMVCAIPNRGVRAYFCELAGAQAILHANDPTWPDTGLDIETQFFKIKTAGGGEKRCEWWELPMSSFTEQVRQHCHRCGIPLRRMGQPSQTGEQEEVSETHQGIYQPKERGRNVQLVQVDAGPKVGRVTEYLGNGRLVTKQ